MKETLRLVWAHFAGQTPAMLRRAFLIISGLALLVLVSGFFIRRFASEDQRIAWLVADVAEGFNATRMRPVIRAFADDYVDEGSGTTRDRVRDILRHLYFREIDPTSKRFRFRVEIPADELTIELPEGEPQRAMLGLHAIFYCLEQGAEVVYWDARIRAELEERDGSWKFVRTFDVNHADRRE